MRAIRATFSSRQSSTTTATPPCRLPMASTACRLETASLNGSCWAIALAFAASDVAASAVHALAAGALATRAAGGDAAAAPPSMPMCAAPFDGAVLGASPMRSRPSEMRFWWFCASCDDAGLHDSLCASPKLLRASLRRRLAECEASAGSRLRAVRCKHVLLTTTAWRPSPNAEHTSRTSASASSSPLKLLMPPTSSITREGTAPSAIECCSPRTSHASHCENRTSGWRAAACSMTEALTSTPAHSPPPNLRNVS